MILILLATVVYTVSEMQLSITTDAVMTPGKTELSTVHSLYAEIYIHFFYFYLIALTEFSDIYA